MTRSQFLLLATVFQGGLLLLGIGLAAWQDVAFAWDWRWKAVFKGVISTTPLLLFLWWALTSSWSALQTLRETLVHRFGPIVTSCSLLDLLYVSLLAGISEEVLFRGVIQNLLLGGGLIAAVLGTNLLFGLCHAASPVYFGYAFLAGCYLSWVAGIPDQNLIPAIISHALYDLIALSVIRQLASQHASVEVDSGESIEECADSSTNVGFDMDPPGPV